MTGTRVTPWNGTKSLAPLGGGFSFVAKAATRPRLPLPAEGGQADHLGAAGCTGGTRSGRRRSPRPCRPVANVSEGIVPRTSAGTRRVRSLRHCGVAVGRLGRIVEAKERLNLRPLPDTAVVRRPMWIVVFVIAAIAAIVVLSGCGDQVRSAGPSRSTINAELKGSPPRLDELHVRANRLLPGGPQAFTALLVSLRGYPVVVNEWASWCSNCSFESPDFQRMAAKYGTRVAFVGVDVEDHHDAAAAFLRDFPVTYPSYVDPHQSIARSLEASGLYPQTLYFDRHGRFVIDHAGSYANADALEQAIRRYAWPPAIPLPAVHPSHLNDLG